jgi:hypothetical protein
MLASELLLKGVKRKPMRVKNGKTHRGFGVYGVRVWLEGDGFKGPRVWVSVSPGQSGCGSVRVWVSPGLR